MGEESELEEHGMDDQPTCGEGLAEHSRVPAKIEKLLEAMAEVLEVHMTALDPTDEHSQREQRVYAGLAKKFRQVAADLGATATRMAEYRDLPMGRHDLQAMSGPQARESFATFVRLEQELLSLLEERLELDRVMLVESITS
jgi:hypothetical protein